MVSVMIVSSRASSSGIVRCRVQLAAPDDHVPHNMVDGVMVDARAARDHVRQVAADVSQKLCRIAGLMMSRIRRKDPVEIALIGSRPVDGVVRAFAAIVFAQRFL